ncbi:MAG: hypothetical protein COW03_00355 [Cytophagales bacterium CG12_big_fil_rev_8_21_14_0_65_40_12]|nr:MAG: hypothetical protein COW03_00355 [Cytophagales bacterium CG12_big_fil_rev_8_21_14_0_65_40_12]PIW04556.1 MAG: hypothetical protein COW40_09135 [Cytophagales bacterium CG17_big_fil_post_rev_8_21_14_2_50_40_13]
MKVFLIGLFLAFSTSPSFGQELLFELELIKFNGLSYQSTKDEIVKIFGIPKIIDPQYECGAYSESQPGAPYEQLIYKGFIFIGNEKEKYILQEITFDSKGEIFLEIDGHKLSNATSKDRFIELFGEKAKTYFDDNLYAEEIKLYPKDQDSGYIFSFEEGRLLKIHYWSPC